MKQDGAEGYVLINFDGIPVMFDSKSKDKGSEITPAIAVQYSALVSDLIMKTKNTLKQLDPQNSEFEVLRMRTKQDTELIVTNLVVGNSHEYILVCI